MRQNNEFFAIFPREKRKNFDKIRWERERDEKRGQIHDGKKRNGAVNSWRCFRKSILFS